jgi:chemotaxis signal transduction protein
MPESSELIKKFIETISHEPPKLELRGIRMELRSLVHRLTEQQEMLVSIRQEFDREKRRQASLKYQPPINPKPRLSRTLLKMRDELQSELRQVHNLKNSLERIISESKREHAKFIREKKNFMMDQENVKRRLTDLVEKNPEAATKSRAFSPVLTFKLNSDLYCIDANLVLEIIRGQMISITAQPGFVEGMLNYHGTPIPVLSLKARLGLGDSTKHAFTMIVHSDYGPVGLAIDEACQVLNLSTDEITRSPVSLDRRRAPASEYVRGVWHLGSKQLTCLNVEEILNTIQLRRITAQIQKSIKHQALGVHVRG